MQRVPRSRSGLVDDNRDHPASLPRTTPDPESPAGRSVGPGRVGQHATPAEDAHDMRNSSSVLDLASHSSGSPRRQGPQPQLAWQPGTCRVIRSDVRHPARCGEVS